MKHSELVKISEKWLRNTIKCRVVLSELVAYTDTGETPDGIGWARGCSILVECKTSHTDFLTDQKKRSRQDNMPALGNWRFYISLPGIIQVQELKPGWGLYEVKNKRVIHAGGIKYCPWVSAPFQSHIKSEVAMLVSVLSRLNK